MAGIRAFEAVDKDPIGFGVVIPQLEHSDFGRPQAGMVGQPEDGAIRTESMTQTLAREHWLENNMINRGIFVIVFSAMTVESILADSENRWYLPLGATGSLCRLIARKFDGSKLRALIWII